MIKVQGPTSPPLLYPEVIDRACALKSGSRPFPAKKTKDTNKVGNTLYFRGPLFIEWRADGVGERLSPHKEKYIHSNLTSASETKREEGGDGVIPDMFVYTFDHRHSRGLGSIKHRRNREGAAPSAATPPASARGAAAVDTKHAPLVERNHPRAVTILQSPNGSNINEGGRRFLVWQATITQPSDEQREGYRNALDNHRRH